MRNLCDAYPQTTSILVIKPVNRDIKCQSKTTPKYLDVLNDKMSDSFILSPIETAKQDQTDFKSN